MRGCKEGWGVVRHGWGSVAVSKAGTVKLGEGHGEAARGHSWGPAVCQQRGIATSATQFKARTPSHPNTLACTSASTPSRSARFAPVSPAPNATRPHPTPRHPIPRHPTPRHPTLTM